MINRRIDILISKNEFIINALTMGAEIGQTNFEIKNRFKCLYTSKGNKEYGLICFLRADTNIKNSIFEQRLFKWRR